MSSPKRRAAADIFMEQNQEKYVADREPQAYAPPPPPPPAPSMPAGMPTPLPAQAMSAAPAMQRGRVAATPPPRPPQPGLKTSEELQLEKEPIRVRETGVWLWKRVIVPPSAYVVHTRMSRKTPVTLGLGISFRYNPDT